MKYIPLNLLFWGCLMIQLILLSGCHSPEVNHHYLSFMGESDSWKLSGYEVDISPDGLKVGNGILSMKDHDEYKTDFFSFNTYVVIDGEETRIHAGSVSGPGIDIAKEMTGAIEDEKDHNQNPLSLDDVSQIYMTVEWWDVDKKEDVKERIDLYDEQNKEESFLE